MVPDFGGILIREMRSDPVTAVVISEKSSLALIAPAWRVADRPRSASKPR